MDRSYARRDALRIFRLLLIIQLAMTGLSFLAVVSFLGTAPFGLLLGALPIVILAILFVPPWLERVFGRYFLALGLSLSVLFSSFDLARDFSELPYPWLGLANIPPELTEQAAAAPPIEPFLFVLIPLVLMAWAYGRPGALLGSSWAALLYLAVTIGVTAHGGIPPLSMAQALARIALIYILPFIVSFLAERERIQHDQLQEALERVRRHAATVDLLATSRERNRLARELHDTLAHSLSAISVQLEALRTLLANDPESAPAAVDQIGAMARQGLVDSRNAIQSLRTDPVEALGLTDALREELVSLEARTGVRSRLSTAGAEPDLTLEEAQALFRIAEEALNNVERHAAATQVGVHLAYSQDQVVLMIHDDGRGFHPETVDPERYGLAGMRERAAMIGATLDMRSRPGGGTQVWCTLNR